MRCKFVRLAKMMCQNFKMSTKSQKLQFYSILVAIPCLEMLNIFLIKLNAFLVGLREI